MKTETITYRKSTFTIVEKTPITKWPALAAENPNVEFSFIAEGKNGRLIDGYISKGGAIRVF